MSGTYQPVVLVVEDEESQREFYRAELEDAGYRVLTAASGREALEVIQREHVDVVVLDIAMPGMDGIETLSRTIGVNRQLPVILNTAYSDYRDDYTTWSAEAYIIKSSNLAELHRTLQRALRKRGVEPPPLPEDIAEEEEA
ncbi:MAG: response regulator [Armatimonadetes bacterium]|nr:response regulator [Armatimonadota bacterium]